MDKISRSRTTYKWELDTQQRWDFKSLGKDALFDNWLSIEEIKSRSVFHYHIKISPNFHKYANVKKKN